MNTLKLSEALQTFEQLFTSAQHSMFKAEVLQDYSAVDDISSLRAWLAGDKERSRQLAQNDAGIIAWREKCLRSPASVTRVHVTVEPYTPYLEWEIDVIYKGSLLPSGAETVMLAPLSKLNTTNLPSGDFWIFDDKHVLQWEYENGNGKLVGGKVWGEQDDIAEFLELRQKLLAVAQPIA